MGPFKRYIDSLLEIWKETAPAARIGIVFLAILCVAAIIGVGYWSAQPSYVTLVSNAEHEKMDKVIDALDKAGIDYQLSGAGGNLKVDKREFAKARMIARGKGVSESETSSLGMGTAFGSPSERRNLAREKKQQSLAATIRKFNVVEQADVHLNVPDKGPFERKSSPPSASVLLTLSPDSSLTDEQASSIASLVAFAVEDLEPESVQITDKSGRSYTIPDERVHHISSQIEYTTENEKKLARKAESQLLHFVGPGNASVQVSLDLTFTNGSKTTTRYDADGKVPTQEDLNTETTTRPRAFAGGPAGTESNLDNGTSRRSSKGEVQNKSENIKTSYLVPKTEEVQNNTTPIRNFMTVSVLVNSDADGIRLEDGTLLPGIEERVKGIVENAVGFRESNDTISVEFLPFPASELAGDVVVTPPFNWEWLNELIRNASLAIAALSALLIGFLVLRKIKPPTPTTDNVVRLDSDRSQNISQLSELVKNNPEIFSQIVESWAGSPSGASDESSKRDAA